METKLTNMNIEKPTASETVDSPPSPPWIELPGDVTANILQRLGAEEIFESAQKVCTTWRKACLDPAMWRVIELEPTSFNPELYDNLLCRFVVDLSKWQLIDLKISYFGDDELIHYIADRSSHLQRLTLDSCEYVTGTALSKALKKLPQLEELHIIIHLLRAPFHANHIEAFGISCPMLKSFSYSYAPYTSEDDPKLCNEYASAIGKTMPNLRHLQLLQNWMTNEGLEAILDGCPHLESLDISGYFCLDLQGALGKRCSRQIKNLTAPSDADGIDLIGLSEKYTRELINSVLFSYISFDEVDCGLL